MAMMGCAGASPTVAPEPLEEPRAADAVNDVNDEPSAQANAVGVAVSTQLSAADTGAAIVNLLEVVPSQVVVSTSTGHARRGPARMLDGRLETAWNSASGDLRGWIAVAIPSDARVDRIELIGGFVRNERGRELWSQNHRITELEVRKDGVVLGRHTLDPDSQAFQAIPIESTGGVFELHVVDTAPGSRRTFSEVCVTELRVMGTPGAARGRVQPRIGSLAGAIDETVFISPLASVDRNALRADAEGPLPELQGPYLVDVHPFSGIRLRHDEGEIKWWVYWADLTRDQQLREAAEVDEDPDPDCDAHQACAPVRVARVSYREGRIPVVDHDVALPVPEHCHQDEPNREAIDRFVYRDFDQDGKREAWVEGAWEGFMMCGLGGPEGRYGVILDADTLRVQLQMTQSHREHGGECAERQEGRYRFRDQDGDGHPDVRRTLQETTPIEDDDGECEVRTTNTTSTFRYDPSVDSWVE